MKLQERLVLGLVFFITFANTDVKIYQLITRTGSDGVIPVQHGFYIPMALAFVLIIMKWNEKDAGPLYSGEKLNIFYPLILWFFAATISLIFNTWYQNTVREYIGGYVSLIIIYFALRDFPLAKKNFHQIMMAFSFGIVITLLLGLIVYYRMWGIPSLTTLIYSRYDVDRMQNYRNITFGNVGNIASFFIMIGPSFLAFALDKTRNRLMRIWFTICFILVSCNLLITGSRAAFIVMLLAVILIFYYFKKLGKLLFISMLGFILGLFLFTYFNLSLSGGMQLIIERFVNVITLNQKADFSILSRFEAIREGWDVSNDHWLIGVGPGSSFYYISATTAHQFFIQQAAQLGILGFFSSIILVLLVFWGLVKITLRRGTRPFDTERFIFLIGPAMFLLYGVIANIALNSGSVNIWVTVMAAFLALAEFREVDSRLGARVDSLLGPKDAPATVVEGRGQLGVGQAVESEFAPEGMQGAVDGVQGGKLIV